VLAVIADSLDALQKIGSFVHHSDRAYAWSLV
jgi:hypothetical protein